jgi:hypothetical protein
VSARVRRNAPDGLGVSYVLEGDLGRLRVPAPRPPRPAERLWQHTCCEIFVARKGGAGYHEYNLSPSGEWAAYAFVRYRVRREGGHAALAPPRIRFRSSGDVIELDAAIELDGLVPATGGGLTLAVAAVIEDKEGSLSYWALRHPPGKPDFHHPDAFALELLPAIPGGGK